MRGATLFSGGGGVEAMLKDHINFVHAVEFDPAIAAVYARNIGPHITVADVCGVDYTTWGKLDYLHASPVCKNASQAKTDGEESDTDIETALAVVRCLEATQPDVFTLENVWGYRTFEAFRRICQALDRGGYMWHFEHLNSADFGVPQTRRRLILRASRGLLPTLPPAVPWVGWYAAIEDLILGLPPSQFAPWQLARLPEGLWTTAMIEGTEMRGDIAPIVAAHPCCTVKSTTYKGMPRAFIVSNAATLDTRAAAEPMVTVTATTHSKAAMPRACLLSNDQQEYSDGLREASDSAHAITRQSGGRYRALLVSGQNARSEEKGGLTAVAGCESAYTITNAQKGVGRAWLATGRVVKMTPRALARFQSLPDWYDLPDKASLACTIIGNMVPSLMMQTIVEQLI